MCCEKVFALVATTKSKYLQSRSCAMFCTNAAAPGRKGSSVNVPDAAPELSESTQ
jgi:hypothetical protein